MINQILWLSVSLRDGRHQVWYFDLSEQFNAALGLAERRRDLVQDYSHGWQSNRPGADFVSDAVEFENWLLGLIP